MSSAASAETSTALSPVSPTATPRTAYTGAAVITAGSQTVTAYELPGTTGLGVINGSTLSYGGPGVTLADGAVLSLGEGGVVASQTTVPWSSTSITACPVPASRTKTLRPYTGSGASSGGALTSSATQSESPTGTQAGASSPVSTGAAPRTGVSAMQAMVWALAVVGTFMI